MKQADLWLPLSPRGTTTAGRLVIFPHAGCGAGQWFRWSEATPPWIEVRVARLPGRESRLSEPVLTSPDAAITALAQALAALPPMPTVLFGHSLGAQLVYAICRRLPGIANGLIVSGSSAPGRRVRECLSALPDHELAEVAHRRWQAIPDEIRCSDELRALFLPALRGDLKLAENWPDDDHPPLALPLVVVAGKADTDILQIDIDGWCAQTTGPTSRIEHRGGHMQILEDPALRRRVIGTCVELLLA